MVNALFGGVLIGLAVSLMMLFNGRVTGISGILGGILRPNKSDLAWRLYFLAGLFLGGVTLVLLYPDSFIQHSSAKYSDYIFSGLLVGFGTLLGNGCTSGHGVCGISRFSIRSIIATVIFIAFGIFSVVIFKFVRGSL